MYISLWLCWSVIIEEWLIHKKNFLSKIPKISHVIFFVPHQQSTPLAWLMWREEKTIYKFPRHKMTRVLCFWNSDEFGYNKFFFCSGNVLWTQAEEVGNFCRLFGVQSSFQVNWTHPYSGIHLYFQLFMKFQKGMIFDI